jgi:hypothetical protein
MTEQSLRDRLHATHEPVDTHWRMKLLLGAFAGIAAATVLGGFNGLLWAIPGLIIAGACVLGLFTKHARPA